MSSSAGNRKIPLSEPRIAGNEWRYIRECLDTGWVSSAGKYVEKFEADIAAYTGAGYAVATVNGTAALHVNLLCSGVEAADEVIVPALTFVAPVNTVRYCGAYPVFMDCTSDTLCLDCGKLEYFLDTRCEYRRDGFTYNKETGRRLKAVVPVHVFGHPVDMDILLDICSKRNILIIEDATESLGSQYKGKYTGTIGVMGCFSFNGNKIITTGGGGMVVTDNSAMAEKVRHLSTQAKCGSIEYDHDAIGYNYRITNIQAAMGVAQLERIDECVDIKRRNAGLYSEMLSDMEEVKFLKEKQWARSNFWFYTIRVRKEHKRRLMEFLLSRNIQVRSIWKPIHTLPMYRDCQTFDIVNTVEAYEGCMNIPCSVGLERVDLEYIAESIREYFRR